MRKLVIVAVAAVFMMGMASVAFADSQEPTSRPAGKHFGARIDKQLNLTDDQKAKIKEIRTQAREDAKKAETPQAKREIMKAAWEKIRTTVLTDEQRTKLGKMRQGMMRHEFLGKLNLTEEQKGKIKSIMDKAHADMTKATTPEAKHEIMAAARKDIRTNVLTDEQRKKLTGMTAGFKRHTAMKELNLTDDQKAKIKEIMTAARAEAGKLAKDAREARAKIMKDAWEKVKTTVLTKEQADKLKELKEKHGGHHGATSKPAGE